MWSADENTEAVIIEEIYDQHTPLYSYGHLIFICDEKSCVQSFTLIRSDESEDELGIGICTPKLTSSSTNVWLTGASNASLNKCSVQYVAVCGIVDMNARRGTGLSTNPYVRLSGERNHCTTKQVVIMRI